MPKITAKKLYLQTQKILTDLGVPQDRFEMYVEPRLLDGEKWYIVRMACSRRGRINETGVFFKRDCGPDQAEMFRKFSWLVEAKAKWLLTGRRVKNQGFYDTLWYTAAWELNQNPFCTRWAVIDEEDGNRHLLIQWGTKHTHRFRTDILLFSLKDFDDSWYTVYQDLVCAIRKVAREVSGDARERGHFPLRLRSR